MEKITRFAASACAHAEHAAMTLKKRAKEFFTEEKGEASFIAVILILAIVIALVVVFRKQIFDMFDKIWKKVSDGADDALSSKSSGYTGG